MWLTTLSSALALIALMECAVACPAGQISIFGTCISAGSMVAVTHPLILPFILPLIPAVIPSAQPIKILQTGYATLPEIGKEVSNYGLYSYAILVSKSERSSAFLTEIFKTITPVGELGGDTHRVNILYVPLRKDKKREFAEGDKTSWHGDFKKMGEEYANNLYDFSEARLILDHICGLPPAEMREICQGDLSRGPYIFTYTAPASKLDTVPPPYLFVDLSPVAPRAFGEWLLAYRAQVKRDDMTDGARINTFRLRLLSVALTASDLVTPVKGAVKDVIEGLVHTATASPKSDK